jgi:hypothetical protein
MNNKEKFSIGGGIAGILAFILKLVEYLSSNNQYIIASVFVLLCLVIATVVIFLISWHYKDIISELRANNKTISDSLDNITKVNRQILKEERENNDKLKRVGGKSDTENS